MTEGTTIRYSWTQPACDKCWSERHPERGPVRLKSPEVEQCVFCATRTDSGIYVRISPEEAPFPSLLKD
jgi:hypothetical protein